MKFTKNIAYKDYYIFFWLILIAIIGVFVTTIYNDSKEEQNKQIIENLNNIYLKKTVQEITNNLSPRFRVIEYISKSGDTYEDIVENLKINKKEKKNLLKKILNEKSLKILRINQKFTFKFDNLSDQKIIEFKIETDKKNEIVFNKIENENKFVSKKIKKNFLKKLVYKETIITSSLYNSYKLRYKTKYYNRVCKIVRFSSGFSKRCLEK